MEEFETEESNSALNKKVMDTILFKRNELMAKVIADAIEENPKTIHIFAAGTAHFVVGPSVVDLLRKSGLKVSRVTPGPPFTTRVFRTATGARSPRLITGQLARRRQRSAWSQWSSDQRQHT